MYNIKWIPELGWAAAFAVATYAAQVLADFDPDTISDWQTYAVAIGAGAVRVVGATLLNKLRELGTL